jgi:hypothetical protein
MHPKLKYNQSKLGELMRYWVAAVFYAAIMSASVNRATAESFAIKLNEQDREYRNTGTITLRDPITGALLGKYEFATGGFGRGSAPFGTYELGPFRDINDDPHRIGPRWMIKQHGQSEDGHAYDPRLKGIRTGLELHSAGRLRGSQGCIAVLGGPKVWEEFMYNLNHIISEVGHVAFSLVGKPEPVLAAGEPGLRSAAVAAIDPERVYALPGSAVTPSTSSNSTHSGPSNIRKGRIPTIGSAQAVKPIDRRLKGAAFWAAQKTRVEALTALVHERWARITKKRPT